MLPILSEGWCVFMEKRSLFLFGECAEERFLSQFPVPVPPCAPYTLEGYAMGCNAAGRAFLSPDPTAPVSYTHLTLPTIA